MNEMSYKGYFTKVKYSAEDGILFGVLEGIDDFVNFEADSLDKVEEEFHQAVDDYLIFCEEIGKVPQVPKKEPAAVLA